MSGVNEYVVAVEAERDRLSIEAFELRAENEKLKERIRALEEEANRCDFCDKPGVHMHREKMYCEYHYMNGAD
jgi:hypothetical protein